VGRAAHGQPRGGCEGAAYGTAHRDKRRRRRVQRRQKQRILIARALINKPKIIFFDEATSALDNISQKTVSDNMDSLKSTRIIIAHRLSTIRHCDRIIVLNKGKIAEQGSFEQLMEQKGLFYEMSKRQL